MTTAVAGGRPSPLRRAAAAVALAGSGRGAAVYLAVVGDPPLGRAAGQRRSRSESPWSPRGSSCPGAG